MKKRILYFCVFVLYLLIACTILSQKIEEEMATLVLIQEHSPVSKYNSGSSMTADALFYEDGVQKLYEVAEGEGWQSGLRISLVQEDRWEYVKSMRDFVRFAGGRIYRFVETASRTPAEGGLVRTIEGFETGEDQYLLLYPDEVPEGLALPETWHILSEKETAMLLAVSEVEMPFFQHRAKFRAGISREESVQIISLSDAAAFLEQLPAVALTAAVLLVPVILWLLSAGMVQNPRKYRVSLALNGAMAAAVLFALRFLLERFSFPASILPPESILDVTHYEELFSGIFAAMQKFGNTVLHTRWLEIRGQMWEVMGIGAMAGVFLCLAEWLVTAVVTAICRWQASRYRGKYLAVKTRRQRKSRAGS